MRLRTEVHRFRYECPRLRHTYESDSTVQYINHCNSETIEVWLTSFVRWSRLMKTLYWVLLEAISLRLGTRFQQALTSKLTSFLFIGYRSNSLASFLGDTRARLGQKWTENSRAKSNFVEYKLETSLLSSCRDTCC